MINKNRFHLIFVIALVITGVFMFNAVETKAFEGAGMNFLYSDKDIITANFAASDGKNGASFGLFFSAEASSDNVVGVDLGYNRAIFKYLIIGAELSVGHRTGVSGASGETLGVGLTADVPITERIKVMSSFNPVKGTSVGIGLILSF